MQDFSMYKPQRLVWLFLACITFFVIVFPYARTEYTTWRHSDKLDAAKICVEYGRDTSLNYFKLLSYQGSRRQSEMYCIFQNPERNVFLQLEQQAGNWKVIYSRLLNTEATIYYPFYL